MDDPDAYSPPLPRERSAPAAVRTGCIALGGLSLLPILYVGSFAALMVDRTYDGPVLEALDERTLEFLEYFYWPLIVLYEQFV